MNIAIIDADLLKSGNHRFPNLVCLKLSGYHKSKNDKVRLILSWREILDTYEIYDRIYLAKVFTNTEVPIEVLLLPNLQIGGTGFYFDKAPPLPYEIEHHMPDYHLYDEFVEFAIASGRKPKEFKFYTDYSIGFLTRGCFRKCEFCVNRNCDKVYKASSLSEFLDTTRPKICLLDDNFFGYEGWRELLQDIQNADKPFQFRQGFDERLLTKEKIDILIQCKYDGRWIMAFDNIADRGLIESKLKLIREHTDKEVKFYVLVGFDRTNTYDESFFRQDIVDCFERIKLLGKYRAFPYIMRHEDYNKSPYRGIFVTIARWCNQPSMFRNLTLNEYIDKTHEKAPFAYRSILKESYPEIIDQYFNEHYLVRR